MGSASSVALCSSSTAAIVQPAAQTQSLYCHYCRGVISSGPSAFLAGQGRFGLNGSGVAECPRCRGTFVEMLTEHERRRIQVASPLRQVRVAATNIMPGRRVTANDIVYTFFLLDNDAHRDLLRDSDLDAAITQSLDEAAGSPQKSTAKNYIELLQNDESKVCSFDIEKQTSCPICDEALTMAEAVLRLSCKHVFHESCLVPWLATHNTCPVCREELPAEPEDPAPKPPQVGTNPGDMERAAAVARRSFLVSSARGGTADSASALLNQRPPTPVMLAAGMHLRSPQQQLSEPLTHFSASDGNFSDSDRFPTVPAPFATGGRYLSSPPSPDPPRPPAPGGAPSPNSPNRTAVPPPRPLPCCRGAGGGTC